MPIPLPQKTLRLGTIEVLAHDLEQATYPWAVREIERLGEGWRLPTPLECSMLQQLSDLGVGGLVRHRIDTYYWTSQQNQPNPSFQCTWSFAASGPSWHSRDRESLRVRPVRSI